MKKRKGFTLSELLVVVVIIGVLSAVVLPKFSKVIETRKTTEAEELMSAVRTEQEARCTLSRSYTDQTSKLGSYKDGKNFDYSLGAVGMTASAKSGKYTLEMPSYADGRICCSSGCDTLNKNYPLCSDLTNKSKTPDYVAGNADCGIEIETEKETPTPDCELTSYTKTCQEEGYASHYTGSVTYTVNASCTGYDRHDSCTKPACTLSNYTRTCQQEGYGNNYTGSVIYTVNSDCTGYNKNDTCTKQCDNSHKNGAQEYENCTCGKATYTWSCSNATNYEWQRTLTTACKDKPQDETRNCTEGTGTQTRSYTCQNAVWEPGNWIGECTCPGDKTEEDLVYKYRWDPSVQSCVEYCIYGQKVRGLGSDWMSTLGLTQEDFRYKSPQESANMLEQRCQEKLSPMCNNIGVTSGKEGKRGDTSCYVCQIIGSFYGSSSSNASSFFRVNQLICGYNSSGGNGGVGNFGGRR